MQYVLLGKPSQTMVEGAQMAKIMKTVSVVNDCRDLGAHFNATGGRKVGTTATQRMWKTARSTDRLAKVKAPYNKKVEIIRAEKLPMGL